MHKSREYSYIKAIHNNDNKGPFEAADCAECYGPDTGVYGRVNVLLCISHDPRQLSSQVLLDTF